MDYDEEWMKGWTTCIEIMIAITDVAFMPHKHQPFLHHPFTASTIQWLFSDFEKLSHWFNPFDLPEPPKHLYNYLLVWTILVYS